MANVVNTWIATETPVASPPHYTTQDVSLSINVATAGDWLVAAFGRQHSDGTTPTISDAPAWDPTKTYNPGDLVSYNAQVYVSIATSLNQTPNPAGTAYWTLSSGSYNAWDLIFDDENVVVWLCRNAKAGISQVIIPGSSYGGAVRSWVLHVDEVADVTSYSYSDAATNTAGGPVSLGDINSAYFPGAPVVTMGNAIPTVTVRLMALIGSSGNPNFVYCFVGCEIGDTPNQYSSQPPLPIGWTDWFGEGYFEIFYFTGTGSYVAPYEPGNTYTVGSTVSSGGGVWTAPGPNPPTGPPPGNGWGSGSDIVTDICLRAGLDPSQIDVSLLTDANIFGGSTRVPGFVCERPTAAAELLHSLMQGYFFDGVETNGAMKWVPRGMASAMTIPETDLGLLADKAKVKPEQISQSQDLPLSVKVLYVDVALDYQQGSQERARSARIKVTKQQDVLSLPIAMLGAQALQIAEAALYLAWLERNSYVFSSAAPKYLQLDPTDVIEFVYEGNTFEIRISEMTLGQGFAVSISGVNQDSRNFLSSLTLPDAINYPRSTPILQKPPATNLIAPTTFYLFDIPLLRDTDANPSGTGIYFALASGGLVWTGAVLYESADDSNFTEQGSSTLNTTYGYATTTLGAPPRSPWVWDETNTLTVSLVTGSFAGDSKLNVLNGSNAIIVGSEIIQFRNAVQNMDGTYTLSGLLRGRRGTEGYCGTHGSNELVIMPKTGFQRLAEPLSFIGQALYYKGVTNGQDPSTGSSIQFTAAGVDLKPYAPTHITGSRDGSNNLTINWVRRTRIGGEADWQDGVTDVPLSEDSENYQVDIMNGSTVVRTISVTSPTASYSAANQTTDFGSTQSSLSVKVYQMSGEVGRGFAGAATI